jgi:predicted transcriptional regulator
MRRPRSTIARVNDARDDESDVLGPLERRVMTQLWRDGPQSVGEVRDALNRSGARTLAYTTVMTILVRLHEKGYLARQKEGRRYTYVATVDETSLRAQVGRRELSRLIERYGVGSVAGFAAELGEGDLADRLARLARESRQTT